MGVLLGEGIIRLVADATEAIRSLKQVSRSADDIGAAAERSRRSLTGSLTSTVKWGLGVAASVAAAGYSIYRVVDAASDLSESVNKVEVVFGSAAAAVEEFAATAARSVGMSRQVALEAAGTFGNLFTSMGLGRDAAADMSVGLVKLAADLASFNNLSPDVVLEKLRSGLVGEVEPLRVLGVNLTQAAVKAKAMEMGLIGAGEELTQAAAIQARYALVLEQTQNAQGDFARTSGGLANQMRILKAQWADLKAKLGAAFLPLVQAAVQGVNRLLEALSSWRASPGLGRTLDMLHDLAAVVTAIVSGDIGRLSGLFQKVGVSESIQKGIFRFIIAVPRWLNTMRQHIARVWADVQARMGPWLEKAFGKITAWWDENGPTVVAAAQQVMAWLSEAFGWLAQQVVPVLNVLLPLLDGLINVVLGTVTMVAQIITGDWAGVWESFKGIVASALRAIWASLTELFDMVLGWMGSSWSEFLAMWAGIWEQAAFLVRHWREVVGLLWRLFWDWVVNIIQSQWARVQAIWQAAQEAIRARVDAWLRVLRGKWRRMRADLAEALQSMIQRARDRIHSMYQAGVDFIMGFWNGLKSKFDALLAWAQEKFRAIMELVERIYDIGSPSRKMIQAGRYIMQGLRIGMEDVYRATKWARLFQAAPVVAPDTRSLGFPAAMGAEIGVPEMGGRGFQVVQVHLHYSPTISLADEVEMERVLGPFVMEKLREALGGGVAWAAA